MLKRKRRLIASGRLKKGFMCGIAFQHELGEEVLGSATMPAEVFSTVESMKNLRTRTTTYHRKCGIVEVEIRFKRWVEKPT